MVLASIWTVKSRIGQTPEKDIAKAFKEPEVKFVELMRFTDSSMNTMQLYLDNILYDEVEKHISDLSFNIQQYLC